MVDLTSYFKILNVEEGSYESPEKIIEDRKDEYIKKIEQRLARTAIYKSSKIENLVYEVEKEIIFNVENKLTIGAKITIDYVYDHVNKKLLIENPQQILSKLKFADIEIYDNGIEYTTIVGVLNDVRKKYSTIYDDEVDKKENRKDFVQNFFTNFYKEEIIRFIKVLLFTDIQSIELLIYGDGYVTKYAEKPILPKKTPSTFYAESIKTKRREFSQLGELDILNELRIALTYGSEINDLREEIDEYVDNNYEKDLKNANIIDTSNSELKKILYKYSVLKEQFSTAIKEQELANQEQLAKEEYQSKLSEIE